MSLKLQIIHIPEGELLAETLYTLPEDGGLVGRAPECTVPLPDSSKTISSRHARLYRESDLWLIEDMSINGLFINQSSTPLGTNRRHTLVDGDILSCGDYRIMVNLFSPDVSLTPETSYEDDNQNSTDNDPFAQQQIPQKQSSYALDDPFNDHSQPEPQATIQEEPQVSSLQTAEIQPLPEQGNSNGFLDQDRNQLINILESPEQDVSVPEITSHHYQAQPVQPEAIHQQEEPSTLTHKSEIQVLPYPHPSRQEQQELQQLRQENQRLKELLKKRTRLQKKMIYHCMGEALDQTLTDFSPAYLESLFDDYSDKKQGLLRKRDNWRLYTRHFQRVMKEQTTRLTFTARFQAAMSKLQEKET